MAANGMDPEIDPQTEGEYLIAIHGVVKRNTKLIQEVRDTLTSHEKRIGVLEGWRWAWVTGAVFGLGSIGLLVQHLIGTK